MVAARTGIMPWDHTGRLIAHIAGTDGAQSPTQYPTQYILLNP